MQAHEVTTAAFKRYPELHELCTFLARLYREHQLVLVTSTGFFLDPDGEIYDEVSDPAIIPFYEAERYDHLVFVWDELRTISATMDTFDNEELREFCEWAKGLVATFDQAPDDLDQLLAITLENAERLQ